MYPLSLAHLIPSSEDGTTDSLYSHEAKLSDDTSESVLYLNNQNNVASCQPALA